MLQVCPSSFATRNEAVEEARRIRNFTSKTHVSQTQMIIRMLRWFSMQWVVSICLTTLMNHPKIRQILITGIMMTLIEVMTQDHFDKQRAEDRR